MTLTIDTVVFVITVIGTTSAIIGYGNWATKLSKAGKLHSQVVRRTWGLSGIFAAMFAYGAYDIFLLHKPIGFVNWTVLLCGALGLFIVPSFYCIARRSYRESEIRSVIAHDM